MKASSSMKRRSKPSRADEKREIPYCGIYRYEAATGKIFLVKC